MSERINITISDDLFKRLQTVKDSFNISGVCQEALQHKVSLQELRIKNLETKDMNKIIERLRLEKAEHGKIYTEEGYKEGQDDAKSMSYDEIIQVVCNNVNIYTTNVWDNWLEDKIKNLESDDPAFDQEAYLEGWINGATEFWENIKDALK
ncbi:MAG: hypothetical protein LLF92_03420 [Planctomycetaceae bacterium]|nr:hypothetical protein [Planctomycetaceae bacterium]